MGHTSTWKLLLIFCFLSLSCARRHHLDLRKDDRNYVMASQFGFGKGGLLTLTVSHFDIQALEKEFNRGDGFYGFTIDKNKNSDMASYFEKNMDRCLLEPSDMDRVNPLDNFTAVVFLQMLIDKKDGHDRIVIAKKGGSIDNLRIFSCPQVLLDTHLVANLTKIEFSPPAEPPEESEVYSELKNCSLLRSDEELLLIKRNEEFFFSLAFYVGDELSEGAYSVVYHNCPNYGGTRRTTSSMTLDIVERNGGDYLAIGDRFAPAVYFTFSVFFIGAGIAWIVILKKAERDVFKLHYVMLVLVFLKAISVLFHGVNYHFISKYGAPLYGWAILFYVTHLLKGALLFITLVLIGTGWAFIKNFLTNKEKKIFLIVIPFQVLANIAWIVLEESETGDSRFVTWGYIFMFVDLLCCGCILIPIVWSIRHLSEAAGIDGKAASNLQRMKLFRKFYMLVICYIYFTRIVVLIFKMTVPFRYTYLNSVFQEGGTLVFFLLTGYAFRPTLENPYLKLAQDEDMEEVEMEDVVVYDRRNAQVVKRNHVEVLDESAESLLPNQAKA